MGTVHLTSYHSGLYCRSESPDGDSRVILEPEMLLRPVYNEIGGRVGEYVQSTAVAALKALRKLKGFDSAVSYGVYKYDRVNHIQIRGRVWGEIFCDDPSDPVLTFTHDSRYSNRPFMHLYQWLEHRYIVNKPEKWFRPKPWLQFFHEKLEAEGKILRARAVELRSDAKKLDALASRIAKRLN